MTSGDSAFDAQLVQVSDLALSSMLKKCHLMFVDEWNCHTSAVLV